MVFLVLLIALRFGLRYVALDEMQAWRLDAALITDGFLMFAFGLYGVQRLEMALRARRLLAAARAAGPLPPSEGP